ncbi:N-acetyltransferase 9, partial [Picochlorum sp. SENEW3]
IAQTRGLVTATESHHDTTMIDNWNTRIRGDLVELVPYRRHFVKRYHEWMGDEELLENTASERLTLDEEYRMQEEWKEDDKKCTFIILDATRGGGQGEEAEQARMVGDVNMFWNDYEDDSCVEIEVMIAEKSCRRKGFAREAVTLMMAYGMSSLGVNGYTAKILEKNIASQKLFLHLGYKEVKRVPVFSEIVYKLSKEMNAWQGLVDAATQLAVGPYSVDGQGP